MEEDEIAAEDLLFDGGEDVRIGAMKNIKNVTAVSNVPVEILHWGRSLVCRASNNHYSILQYCFMETQSLDIGKRF